MRLRLLLALPAAGIVLAGPFIRDNGVRALWIAGGFALVILCLRRVKAPGR